MARHSNYLRTARRRKGNSGGHQSLVHYKTGYSTVAGQGERNPRLSESQVETAEEFGLIRVLNGLIMSSISEPIRVNDDLYKVIQMHL